MRIKLGVRSEQKRQSWRRKLSDEILVFTGWVGLTCVAILFLTFPFYIFRKFDAHSGIIKVIIFGVSISVVSILLSIGLNYGAHEYTKLRLGVLGMDMEAFNDLDRMRDVKEEDIEDVKKLYSYLLGVGWPIPAFFHSIFGILWGSCVCLFIWLYRKKYSGEK